MAGGPGASFLDFSLAAALLGPPPLCDIAATRIFDLDYTPVPKAAHGGNIEGNGQQQRLPATVMTIGSSFLRNSSMEATATTKSDSSWSNRPSHDHPTTRPKPHHRPHPRPIRARPRPRHPLPPRPTRPSLLPLAPLLIYPPRNLTIPRPPVGNVLNEFNKLNKLNKLNDLSAPSQSPIPNSP